jgi:hypothetical protein
MFPPTFSIARTHKSGLNFKPFCTNSPLLKLFQLTPRPRMGFRFKFSLIL